MRIVHIAAEALPFIKVGGLADVLGSLPQEQARRGVEVVVMLPRYRSINGPLQALGEFSYGFAGASQKARAWRSSYGGVGYLFLETEPDWREPYQPPEAERYLRFGSAAAAWLAQYDYDLLHAHDWHAAYALRLQSRPSVFTIHNLAFQGELDPDSFERYSGRRADAELLHEGRVNLMKGALLAADRVTTVSPRYAREIQTPEFGMGLDGVLRSISAKLKGILNGLDTKLWDPANDVHLPQRYNAQRLELKRRNRTQMLAIARLDPGLPTLGAVTRLTRQKGFDLVLQKLPEILNMGLNLILVGTGDEDIEAGFAEMAHTYSRRIYFKPAFDEALAHRVYGSTDIFLMPSRFEPCGLSQMIAMRYGTPPVARATGGLADTIDDGETGILFEEASPQGVFDGVKRMMAQDRLAMAKKAMQKDFSWGKRVDEYLSLYREALS